MGLLSRLFHSTPKKELKGIRLNIEQPFWELDGSMDFPSLLRALINLLPEGSILYFEDGHTRGRLLEFIESHRIDEQSHLAVGTLWPRPRYYHIPATAENLSELADLMEGFAEPELAVHFHVYCNSKVILEWHDAFSQPMLLAGTVEEEKVKALGKELNMKVARWKNRSEPLYGLRLSRKQPLL